MKFFSYLTAGLAALVSLYGVPAMAQTKGYYTAPALGDDVLIFASEGDLWSVAPDGGDALRLTTHMEFETGSVISPDGTKVAFSAYYQGAAEIYVMPVTGGTPTRVTFENGGVTPRFWLDDTHFVYRTVNLPGTIPRQLRIVNIENGETSDIPLADADHATLSGDGSTLFFTRFGLSMFNDNAVQYRGGRMAQLWAYTMGSETEATRLAADFGAPIRHPMWWDGRIYFVSDKSGVDNIWSVDETGGDPVQHTHSDEWQIRTPYMHDGKIVMGRGADLYMLDIAAESISLLDIELMSDREQRNSRWISDPLNYLESAHITPDGEGVTITARGRFVTAYPADRRRADYPVRGEHRARSARVTALGDKIITLIDADEGTDIWGFAADGTTGGSATGLETDTYIWELFPAPMSVRVFFSDKLGRLHLIDSNDFGDTVVSTTESSNDDAYHDLTWSTDTIHVAYQMYDARDIAQIAIFNTETREETVVTTSPYNSYAPAFSRDGKWLYFISDRHFDADPSSPWGDRNLGPAFNDRGQVFALQLDPEAEFPFRRPDELDLSEDDDEDADQGDAPLDIAGASARLWQLPVSPGNYTALATTEDHLFVLRNDGDQNTLMRMDFTYDEPELSSYKSDVSHFELDQNAETMLIQTGERGSSRFYLVDPSKNFPSDTSSSEVRVNDWRLRIDQGAEWRSMASDAWRLHRDFAFDPNLRGVDWEAVGEHYLPMASRIGSRDELDDLLSQMSAELGILHSQIRRGDEPFDVETPNSGFLGARYSVAENGLRIEDIWQGEADRPETMGPLSGPDTDIRVGDVITKINGSTIDSMSDLTTALDFKAGQQVLIEFARDSETFEEIIVPVSSRSEGMLLYTDWVEGNHAHVREATAGEIGYLHLRAMGSNDVESFARDFFEHYDKDGLIIDVRGNRGGNVDSWIIGTLLRQAWAFWQSPHGGPPYTNMQQAFRGHLIVLMNEGTYSDGETFAAGVKALDLGPLIGTRTAGAGIWLSDRNPLIDRGQARVAEYAQYGLDGRWLVEGRGVSPDIEVENLPFASYNGEDAQLDAAIAWLEQKIADEPIPELVPQPIPPVGTTGRDVD